MSSLSPSSTCAAVFINIIVVIIIKLYSMSFINDHLDVTSLQRCSIIITGEGHAPFGVTNLHPGSELREVAGQGSWNNVPQDDKLHGEEKDFDTYLADHRVRGVSFPRAPSHRRHTYQGTQTCSQRKKMVSQYYSYFQCYTCSLLWLLCRNIWKHKTSRVANSQKVRFI